MDFKFKHPKTGEIKTVSLSEKRVQEELDARDILRDLLICDCQPIGETNTVELSVINYLDGKSRVFDQKS